MNCIFGGLNGGKDGHFESGFVLGAIAAVVFAPRRRLLELNGNRSHLRFGCSGWTHCGLGGSGSTNRVAIYLHGHMSRLWVSVLKLRCFDFQGHLHGEWRELGGGGNGGGREEVGRQVVADRSCGLMVSDPGHGEAVPEHAVRECGCLSRHSATPTKAIKQSILRCTTVSVLSIAAVP